MSELSLSDFSKRYIAFMTGIFRATMRYQTDELAKGKITVPQFFTLYFIYKSGPLKMSSVAKEMSVSLPAITGLVNRLHKSGMVKRVYDPRDRRIIIIELTPKGRKLVKKILTQRERLISKIFGHIGGDERKEFLRILSKVHDVLYKHKEVGDV